MNTAAYTYSQELTADGKDVWVIRDRRGIVLATVYTIRDALRLVDTLNNDTTNGWN